MTRSFVVSSIVGFSITALLVACGGSSVVVGKTDTSDQKLQTTKNGGATGNGSTCSWADTSLYETYSNGPVVPTYALGDEFKSIDACNECTCTAKGIMCTVKTCEPKGCTEEAMICPDGKTGVGRTGPNCTFAPCPGQVACTDDAKKCADGSYVGRSGPNCEFACPGSIDPGGIACDASAMQCPDGSYVGRSGPNCEFVCPNGGALSCAQLEANAAEKLHSTIVANQACTIDADCDNYAVASNCNDNCANAMAKSGEAAYKAMIASVNSSICADYQKQGCNLIHPACAPSQAARCVDKKCQ